MSHTVTRQNGMPAPRTTVSSPSRSSRPNAKMTPNSVPTGSATVIEPRQAVQQHAQHRLPGDLFHENEVGQLKQQPAD